MKFSPRLLPGAVALAFLGFSPVFVSAQTQSAPNAPLPNAPGVPASAPPAASRSTAAPSTAPPSRSPAPAAAPANATPAQAVPSGQNTSQNPSQPVAQPTPSLPGGPPDSQAAQNGTFTLKQNVNEVNLIFTVTDRHGHFVNNLRENDFALLDDQRAPAQVYSFSQQTNLPLRVGLLIDASTSIRSRFRFEQQAATEFLMEVLRPRMDRAFVMGFDVNSYITQPFTNDPDLLEAGINRLKPGGGTALYDSVYKACRDQMLNAAPPNMLVRKAIILVSDGDDNQSHAYMDDAIKMCERAETILYAISTDTSPSRDRGDDVLQKMAEATGGSAFFPQRMEDVATGFHAIENELRSQYSLAYKPADFKADGAYRPIYLTVLRGGYVVHARKGYFAPK